MADSKITALTALTAADPTNDMIPIVDVSDTPPASGNTKRISINNILSSSPTASGALTVTGLVTAGSATISGALTVDTTTLVVNPSGYVDRVGIGTATPGAALEVSGSATNIYIRSTDTNDSALRYYVNGTEVAVCRGKNGGSYAIETAGTERLRIDSSGNVGIGVTPSAWNSSYRSIQLGSGGAISSHTSASLPWLLATANSFVNSVGDFKFIQNGYSTRYLARGDDGTQSWWTSNNGIAGGTVSYVQSMTLDASGNLLTGTTSALASGNTFQNLGTSRQVLSLKGDAFGSYTLGVWNASTTNDGLFQYFATETTLTVRGGISYNRGGGLVAYNTTSDYRAKDIIGPVSNSGSLIDSLKVYVGKMKGATIERPMLIAHEAQAVAPYAVTGTKDEVDADGNPKYQQMDVSALVPVLIAEIQSLRARVQTLETR